MTCRRLRAALWRARLRRRCGDGASAPTPAPRARRSRGATAPMAVRSTACSRRVCTKCNPKLVPVFQAKGDWCAEHGFPESFCPICHPERGGRPGGATCRRAPTTRPPTAPRCASRRKETARLAGIQTVKAEARARAAACSTTARARLRRDQARAGQRALARRGARAARRRRRQRSKKGDPLAVDRERRRRRRPRAPRRRARARRARRGDAARATRRLAEEGITPAKDVLAAEAGAGRGDAPSYAALGPRSLSSGRRRPARQLHPHGAARRRRHASAARPSASMVERRAGCCSRSSTRRRCGPSSTSPRRTSAGDRAGPGGRVALDGIAGRRLAGAIELRRARDRSPHPHRAGARRRSPTRTARCARTCSAGAHRVGAEPRDASMVPRAAVQRAKDGPPRLRAPRGGRVRDAPGHRWASREARRRRGDRRASRRARRSPPGQLPAQDRDPQGQHRRRLLRGRLSRCSTRVIDWSLRHRCRGRCSRWAAIVAAACIAFRRLPIDAFPDTTPVQVQINTVAPALAPRGGRAADHVPGRAGDQRPARGSSEVRSISKFGLSQVVVIFEDGTDIYFARQLVNERLGERRAARRDRAARRWARSRPAWARSSTTSSRANGDDLTELRTLHDWVDPAAAPRGAGRGRGQHLGRRRASSTRSRVDPAELAKYGLTLDDAGRGARRRTTATSAAARSIRAGESSLVQGVGRVTHASTRSATIVITARRRRADPRRATWPSVAIGHEIRRGARHRRRQGRGRLGLGFMLMGENTPRRDRATRRRRSTRSRRPCPPGVDVDAGLRPDRLVDQRARHGRAEPVRGRRSWSSPCCSPSWATCGPG